MTNVELLRSRNVDVCLCIDKTRSMERVISGLKSFALNLHKTLMTAAEQRGMSIAQFRIRLILFGDYISDSEPIVATRFLTMPEEYLELDKTIGSIVPDGGGDDPEDGLEALAYAIRSDWVKNGLRKRHIIAMFTDAPAHELGYGKRAATYPKCGMPEDFGQLSAMWGDKTYPGEMDNSSKRLLLFAPNKSYWHTISNFWDNVVIIPTDEFTNLSETEFHHKVDTIFRMLL